MATKKKSSKPAAKRSPDELEDVIARVRRLYEQAQSLREKGDAAGAAELVNDSIALAELFRNIRKSAREYESRLSADKPPVDTLDEVVEMLRAAGTPKRQIAETSKVTQVKVNDVIEEGVVEEGVAEGDLSFGLNIGDAKPSSAAEAAPSTQQFSIRQFLNDVSTSVLEAQNDLDKLSLANLGQRSDSGLPRAFYTIPTVKAELKAGFTSTDGKNVSLVLFSRREQRESYGESTVSFELTSVPAPPGAAGPFAAPIASFFLVVGDQRDKLLDLFAPNLSPAAAALRDRALVIRLGDSDGFQVLWPVPDGGGVRFATFRQNGDGTTGEVTLPPPMNANAGQLQAYISALMNALNAVTSAAAAWLGAHRIPAGK